MAQPDRLIWLTVPPAEEEVRVPLSRGGHLVLDRAQGGELFVSVEGHEHRGVWFVRTRLRWPKEWEAQVRYQIGTSITAERRGGQLGVWNCNRAVGRVEFWAVVAALEKLRIK